MYYQCMSCHELATTNSLQILFPSLKLFFFFINCLQQLSRRFKRICAFFLLTTSEFQDIVLCFLKKNSQLFLVFIYIQSLRISMHIANPQVFLRNCCLSDNKVLILGTDEEYICIFTNVMQLHSEKQLKSESITNLVYSFC